MTSNTQITKHENTTTVVTEKALEKPALEYWNHYVTCGCDPKLGSKLAQVNDIIQEKELPVNLSTLKKVIGELKGLDSDQQKALENLAEEKYKYFLKLQNSLTSGVREVNS